MSRTNTTAVRTAAAAFEGLESRLLRSATPAVVAYLPGYEMNTAVVQDLRANGFRGITQVNFFNVRPTAAGVLPGTTVNGQTNAATTTGSETPISDLRTIVADAKKADHRINVSVVIGGAGSDSSELNRVVNGGPAAWDTLAQSIKLFAADYGVNGVDIDWEPAQLASLNERAAYGDLLTRIKQVNPTLHLSAAVAAGKLDVTSENTQAYVLDADAVKALDQVLVMNYDLEAGSVSPMNVATTMMNGWATEIQALGGVKSELVYGVPFYGTAGTTWANTTAETYGELIRKAGRVPAATANSINADGKTYNYNGPATIYAKTDNALDAGYGGVGVWSIGQDYLKNGQYDRTYSLLPQITKAFADNNVTPAAPVVTVPTTPIPTTPTTPTTPVAEPLTGEIHSSSGWYRNNYYTAPKAFDGDLTTYFDGLTAGTAENPEWVMRDFGEGATLSRIKFAPRADAPWTMAGGVFQAANTWDFSDAVDLHSVDATPAAGLTTVNVSGNFRYVRYLAPIGSHGNIAEFQVFGTKAAATTANRVMFRGPAASPFAQSDTRISLVEQVGLNSAI